MLHDVSHKSCLHVFTYSNKTQTFPFLRRSQISPFIIFLAFSSSSLSLSSAIKSGRVSGIVVLGRPIMCTVWAPNSADPIDKQNMRKPFFVFNRMDDVSLSALVGISALWWNLLRESRGLAFVVVVVVLNDSLVTFVDVDDANGGCCCWWLKMGCLRLVKDVVCCCSFASLMKSWSSVDVGGVWSVVRLLLPLWLLLLLVIAFFCFSVFCLCEFRRKYSE